MRMYCKNCGKKFYPAKWVGYPQPEYTYHSRDFLLSTLSYNLSYESACVQLGPRRDCAVLFLSHNNTQSEGILSIVLDRISYHN